MARLLFWIALIPLALPLSAQVTIIKAAPSDSFALNCDLCTLELTDMAVYKGFQSIPYDIKRTDTLNLLHWKYYDKFLEQESISPQRLLWDSCTQLIDLITDREPISLHLNLAWRDSTGHRHTIFLVVSGIYRSNLAKMPLDAIYTTDTGAPQRFSAIAQMRNEDGSRSTFECIEGAFLLTQFDPKINLVSGEFEFIGNCFGRFQTAWFQPATFGK